MSNVHKIISLACVSAFLLSSVAQAEFINFSFEGSADFSIDGTTNSNVDFLISANADTDDVMSNVFDPNLLFVDHGSATIDLGGLGLYTITSGTSTFVNQTSGVFGLGDAGAGFIEFDLTADTFFNTYDLESSFGPVALDVENNNASLTAEDVNGSSTISFLSFLAPVTSSAVVVAVPEPTTLGFLALGCLGLSASRRRKV